LDSSFRLLQLLLVERRPVRPIYILDSGRPGTLHEIRAVEAMRDGVTARLDDPTLLAPIEVHLRTEVPVRPEVMALYSRIAAQVHIGTQYAWLAAAGEAFGWQGVELAMERYVDGPSQLQRLIFDDRRQLNDTPEAQLFRFYSFPVLHLTKAEMAAAARVHGFDDLLALRWFCHTPLGGKACGLCRPCRLAYSDGVDFASPTAAKARRLWRKVHGRSASELARRAVARGSAALAGRTLPDR
jgi:7-cyano-7-deazaguanine synthase